MVRFSALFACGRTTENASVRCTVTRTLCFKQCTINTTILSSVPARTALCASGRVRGTYCTRHSNALFIDTGTDSQVVQVLMHPTGVWSVAVMDNGDVVS